MEKTLDQGQLSAESEPGGEASPGSETEAGTAATHASAERGVRIGRGWRWLPVALLVILLDQLTKNWIAHHFAYGSRVVLLPVLEITLRYNRGAAFSMLADASGWQRWFFTGLALAVAIGIIEWLRRLDARRQWLLAISLSLILAGALGNLIDRLRLGHVIDFIVVHWKDAYFPAFNVADSAITVGAILMLLDAWVGGRRSPS
ncbi:MAG TPA: signal peptidase II [Steroidobacteraceae bacterium]|nr:signal peptidase II [Steroidobacteraceae bacterium]